MAIRDTDFQSLREILRRGMERLEAEIRERMRQMGVRGSEGEESPPRDGQARIPGDLHSADAPAAQQLKGELENLLGALQRITGQKEILVTLRLNRSDAQHPSPVSVGWVDSEALAKRRRALRLGNAGQPPPGFFGCEHLSPIYLQCLNNPDVVWGRDYSDQRIVAIEKGVYPGALQYDIRLGIVYRRHICIKAGGGRAGTLNVGFTVNYFLDPVTDTEIQNALRDWAHDANGPLVRLLERSFVLGGPPL